MEGGGNQEHLSYRVLSGSSFFRVLVFGFSGFWFLGFSFECTHTHTRTLAHSHTNGVFVFAAAVLRLWAGMHWAMKTTWQNKTNFYKFSNVTNSFQRVSGWLPFEAGRINNAEQYGLGVRANSAIGIHWPLGLRDSGNFFRTKSAQSIGTQRHRNLIQLRYLFLARQCSVSVVA